MSRVARSHVTATLCKLPCITWYMRLQRSNVVQKRFLWLRDRDVKREGSPKRTIFTIHDSLVSFTGLCRVPKFGLGQIQSPGSHAECLGHVFHRPCIRVKIDVHRCLERLQRRVQQRSSAIPFPRPLRVARRRNRPRTQSSSCDSFPMILETWPERPASACAIDPARTNGSGSTSNVLNEHTLGV